MGKDIMENGELSEEAKKETFRRFEDDILGGLLAAASFKTDAEGNLYPYLLESYKTDINNLKTINDKYGHACGDRIIRGAAGVIAEVYGVDRTYRIGGDEFLVISENDTEEITRSKFREVDERIRDYNAREADHEGELSISMGAAEFDKDEDTSFQQVFIRADEDMYRKKEEYHRIRNEEAR